MILKIRDASGNVKEILAIKGEDYVLTDADKQEIASLVSGGGVDLSNYYNKTEVNALIPVVPTKVSAFTNDAGYLTAHQSLEGYALKTEIPNVSGFQTEAQVLALIQAYMPPSGDEVIY
jgi:hypothetical protein